MQCQQALVSTSSHVAMKLSQGIGVQFYATNPDLVCKHLAGTYSMCTS